MISNLMMILFVTPNARINRRARAAAAGKFPMRGALIARPVE
jgi:hypothetical protein